VSAPASEAPAYAVDDLLAVRPRTRAETASWLGRVRQFILERLYSGRPADEDSGRCVQLALTVEEATRSAAPALRAEADLIMALALNGNEECEKAIPYYRNAISIFEALGQQQTATRARLGLSGPLQMTGRYPEAIEVLRAADRWFVANDDRHGHARALTNLGNVYHRLDEHARALDCHMTALGIFDQCGDRGAMSMASLNVANAYAFLDRFGESDDMYQRAAETATAIGLGGLNDQARYNRAYLFFLRGRYSDAIRAFNRLRRHFEGASSSRHAGLCDLDESEIYLQLNLQAEAGELAARARDTFHRLGMRYEEAKATAFLGVAHAQRRHYREALDILGVAEAGFQSEENAFWTGMVELYRAEVLLALGRLWEARFLAQSAIDRFETRDMSAQRGTAMIVLGRVAMAMQRPDEAGRIASDLLALIRNTDLPLLEFPAYMLCGGIAEQNGRIGEARSDYEAAARSIEEHRTYLHHDELRVRFLEGKQSVYEALVHMEMESEAPDGPKAFQWSERAKSRGLADLLSQHLPAIGTDADPTLLARVHRLREELNSQYVRSRPDRGEFARSASADQVRRTERELERSLRQLSDADSRYASLIGRGSASLEDVQQALPEETTLVEYFVARGEVLAFLIDKESLRPYRRLCPVERIRKLRQGLDFQMEKFALGQPFATRHAAQMLRTTGSYLERLFDDLIRPWVGDVATRRLVVVPHGDLHALPFHAFFDGEQHLMDRFPVAFAPSAEVLRHSVRSRTSEGEGLLVGVPDPQAPAISEEIRRLRELAPGSRALVGEDATRARFFEHARNARFVHVASHSFFREDNPMFSGFHLADGPVTALDLYSCSWRTELVALGGCSSGVTRIAGGDDLMGLTRGFLHAGARTLLMSLWNVSDDATLHLTEHFYREWLRTGDKASALGAAMARVRQDHPHPFYWAPFVLIGAP